MLIISWDIQTNLREGWLRIFSLTWEETVVQRSESFAQVNQTDSGIAENRPWFSAFTTGGALVCRDCHTWQDGAVPSE